MRSTKEEDILISQQEFDRLWNRNDVKTLTRELIEEYKSVFKEIPFSERHNFVVSDYQKENNGNNKISPNAAQQEALLQLAESRSRNEKRAAVIAATGIGKTFLAAFDFKATASKTLLYISHRKEHLDQAWTAFSQVLNTTQNMGKLMQGYHEKDSDIIFASIQAAARTPEILARRFDYIIVDEFHHAAAPSYQKIKNLPCDFFLGMTATPERQDGHDVLEWCDWNVAYEIRLPEAIRRKWLLPFNYFGISDDTVDLEKLWRKGGFDPNELETALMIENRVDLIYEKAISHGFDGVKRVSVGFCAGVKHAKYMAASFAARGLVTEFVDGTMDLEIRKLIYKKLGDPLDPLEWLFVSDVLNEGVDIPAINCILFLRPTDSPTIFLQQLGRGLRLCDGTEVLTVLDFVGHHRNAWLVLKSLHDPGRGRNPSSIPELEIDPPPGCEIILQDRTLQMLTKIRQQSVSIRDRWLNAYTQLREKVGKPLLPVDFLHRTDVADLGHYRGPFKTWINLQKAAGDIQENLGTLDIDSPLYRLLVAAERDWQRPRISAYAALIGMCEEPSSPEAGYEKFYNRHPKWGIEKEPFHKGFESFIKQIDDNLIVSDRLHDSIFSALPSKELLQEIEGRLAWTIEKDWRTRHGGIIRSPYDLVLWRKYGRSEAVNHFGVQYDPQRHNSGVCWFDQHCMIITKLDTNSAMSQFQYKNQFISQSLFLWSSQNRQRRDNDAGRRIIEHKKHGYQIHLFVQPRSHMPARYMGEVNVLSVKGDAPMLVEFMLNNAVPDDVWIDFNQN